MTPRNILLWEKMGKFFLFLTLFLFLSNNTYGREPTKCHQLARAQRWVEAFQECTIAANNGNIEAKYVLSNFYSDTHQEFSPVCANHTKSFKLLTTAAEQGYPEAKVDVAYEILSSKSTPELIKLAEDFVNEAEQEFLRLEKEGDWRAMKVLNTLYSAEILKKTDKKLASRYETRYESALLRAGVDGDASSQFRLGVSYFTVWGKLFRRNPKESFYWFKKSAEQGNLAAMRSIATYHYKPEELLGLSNEEVIDLRKKYLFDAANNGDIESAYEIGRAYSFGMRVDELGLKKNIESAKKWYLKAAEAGHKEGAYELAQLWADDKEKKVAFKWYFKAAKACHLASQMKVAEYLLDDDFIFNDKAKGMEWLWLIAAIGYEHGKKSLIYRIATDVYAAARYKLGRAYELGDWVAKDYVKAYWAYNLTTSLSTDLTRDRSSKTLRELAKISRDQLEKKMTPDQIAEAQKLTTDWKPNWEQLYAGVMEDYPPGYPLWKIK